MTLRSSRARRGHPMAMWALLACLLLSLASCGGGGGGSAPPPPPPGVAPAITTGPQSQSVVSGSTVTFSVEATGTAPLAYQWQRDGAAIASATTSSLSTGIAGRYTVVVSNALGTATSAAAVLTVMPSLAWNITTGAHEPDATDTSGWLPLTLALDSGALQSASPRLTIGPTQDGVTPVLLDGSGTIATLTRDRFGLTIRANSASAPNLAWRLSGSASTSITLNSATAYKLVLDGATLASPDGPALNLQSKQTGFIELRGSSTLSDTSTYSARTDDAGAAMDLKAALFAEGALVVEGPGTLSVQSAARHALASDAHVRLRSGSVTLTAARRDGLRANDAFVMDGGSLSISTAVGKGLKVDGRERTGVQAIGFVAINAGTLTIHSHDKAITASWESAEDGDTATLADDPDPRVTINGGTLDLATFGTPVVDTNPADGDSSLAPEGIEAKSVLTINGGDIRISATDDALQAGQAFAMNGGRLHARSSTNDAIDSNGTLSISGGIFVAEGAGPPEGGFDCDRAPFTVTGGTFVGFGGRNSTVTAAGTTQNVVSTRGLPAGLWVLRDDAGKAVFAIQLPTAIGSMTLSSPLIATGASYTVVRGGTLGPVTEDFHGMAIGPGTHSGGTAGVRFTVTGPVSPL